NIGITADTAIILKDPGTGPGPAGRITLDEFRDNPLSNLFAFKPPTIAGGGTLAIDSSVVNALTEGLSNQDKPALTMAVSWAVGQGKPTLTFQANPALQQVIKSFTD